MNGAAGLTLAAILALTARFQAGVEAMKAGDPAKAAVEMTAVITAEPGLAELSAGARLLRGQALKAQSKTPEALDDFRWLATRDVAPDVRKKAREEFAAAGGKPESLAPELPPLVEWKRLQEAIRGGEGRKALDWMAVPLRQRLMALGEMMGEGDPGPGDVALWFEEDDAMLTGQAIDEAAGTARLTFREDGRVVHVDWIQDGSRWKIGRMRQEADGEEHIPRMTVIDEPIPSADEGGAGRPPGPRENGAAPDTEPAPELKAEIETCIAQLGASDARARASARSRLEKIGEAARPLLQRRLNDPDPEIATTARELLARP